MSGYLFNKMQRRLLFLFREPPKTVGFPRQKPAGGIFLLNQILPA